MYLWDTFKESRDSRDQNKYKSWYYIYDKKNVNLLS